MSKKKDRPQDYPQFEQKHPDEYEADLNPDRLAGQNIGQSAPADAEFLRASDIDVLTEELDAFTFEELRDIPVLREGARLRQGATYLRLTDERRQPFTATGEDVARGFVVPKHQCPYPLWNRLLGMTDPVRTT